MKSRLTLILLLAPFAAQAQPKTDHWVVTWGTAENLVRPPLPATPPANPAPGTAGFKNQTVRMVVRTSTVRFDSVQTYDEMHHRRAAGADVAAALFEFLQQLERTVPQAAQVVLGAGHRAGHVANAACAFSTSACADTGLTR